MVASTSLAPRPPAVWRGGGALILIGIVLAAFNLRTAVTSVGPLLDEIQQGLGMSATVAGSLTTLPVVAFALLGGLTPALSRRFGHRRVLLTALAVMVAGLLTRAAVDSVAVFLVASALALAGGAVGNVMIPTLVKHYFPNHVGPLTTTYSTALSVGTMVAAAATVPAAQAFGGHWQPALGMWAIPALLAILPWLLARPTANSSAATTSATQNTVPVTRSKLGWTMMAAFGSQSMIAYIMFGWLPEMMRDHGYSPAQAGFMLAVFTGIGIPVAAVVPVLATRMRDQRPLLVALIVAYGLGFPCLWLGGVSAMTWAGVILVGIGMGTFPLMLTLFALRTATPSGTASLSAFAQSGGYLVSGVGPLLVGALLDVTGSWTAPFVLLFAAMVVHTVAGWQVSRNRILEDELNQPEPARSPATR